MVLFPPLCPMNRDPDFRAGRAILRAFVDQSLPYRLGKCGPEGLACGHTDCWSCPGPSAWSPLPDLSPFHTLLPPHCAWALVPKPLCFGWELSGASLHPSLSCRMQRGRSREPSLPQAPLTVTEILHWILLTLQLGYWSAPGYPKQDISSSGCSRGLTAATSAGLLRAGMCQQRAAPPSWPSQQPCKVGTVLLFYEEAVA